MIARVVLGDASDEESNPLTVELEVTEDELGRPMDEWLPAALTYLGNQALRLELERTDDATRAPTDPSSMGGG